MQNRNVKTLTVATLIRIWASLSTDVLEPPILCSCPFSLCILSFQLEILLHFFIWKFNLATRPLDLDIVSL